MPIACLSSGLRTPLEWARVRRLRRWGRSPWQGPRRTSLSSSLRLRVSRCRSTTVRAVASPSRSSQAGRSRNTARGARPFESGSADVQHPSARAPQREHGPRQKSARISPEFRRRHGRLNPRQAVGTRPGARARLRAPGPLVAAFTAEGLGYPCSVSRTRMGYGDARSKRREVAAGGAAN